MWNTILLESAMILAVFLAFTVLAPVLLNFARFAGRFLRTCPHLQQNAQVRVNPFSAAFTAGYGEPRLHVRECSLWGEQRGCEGECLKDGKV